MGSICDMEDVDRFIRSYTGQEVLEDIRTDLIGRTITEVCFANEIDHLELHIVLDNGNYLDVTTPGFHVDALRDEFPDDIVEEYYKDYPERRPQ